MRLNFHKKKVIECLEGLTAAGCPVTPELLAVSIKTQDVSVLNWGSVRWLMHGGYAVYILMTKLPSQSLELSWDETEFCLEDRQEIRASFRNGFL